VVVQGTRSIVVDAGEANRLNGHRFAKTLQGCCAALNHHPARCARLPSWPGGAILIGVCSRCAKFWGVQYSPAISNWPTTVSCPRLLVW